ncbi:hypothetical protein CAOG_03898 [Capsaspora owczarzaki ATCC 30864]|uniref:Uncharacterized protein n=1 Tax=Capsaspora owczarzaki (strain ATCC 30864) TaxID=595528 RepID=A0A0D2VQQ4_CAPO3|nr:hypothetical protein CAOG_03898 [Capsaspora owczarzaki ATCC 30864]KJE93037.1 hypothetical protein CAOG_003898 [Capsaspora owczarzaki ATCC 30864]|eukprot:XP_004363626.1 hypothetical protein CAOG_03898 [Capsaspora owczarzaki ATCC 30864]
MSTQELRQRRSNDTSDGDSASVDVARLAFSADELVRRAAWDAAADRREDTVKRAWRQFATDPRVIAFILFAIVVYLVMSALRDPSLSSSSSYASGAARSGSGPEVQHFARQP